MNGIQRVVLIYRPENLRQALQDFANALDITDFEGPYELSSIGLSVAISWSAGIELIAPLAGGTYSRSMWDVLETKGEGIFSMVYRVDDLEKAEMQAARHGYPRLGDYIDGLEVKEDWRRRFEMLREAALPPVAGVSITLIQMHRPGSARVTADER